MPGKTEMEMSLPRYDRISQDQYQWWHKVIRHRDHCFVMTQVSCYRVNVEMKNNTPFKALFEFF